MDIAIFTTGGTIDKIYFDAKSEYQVGDPHIGEVLKEANVTLDYRVNSILRKDSLDMTPEDRDYIRDCIAAEPCSRILVTHGTDTMIQTALVLRSITDKTIVLTGSMQPASLRISDAVFNIGYALAAVQSQPNGVYVAMNGRIFDPAHARKNVEAHRFEQQ
jgi:L-asparaginase